jgi:hypothetical protein
MRIWIRINIGSWIRIRIRVKKDGSGSAQKVKNQEMLTSGAVDSRERLQKASGGSKIGPWRVLRPVVADSHQFDEEQDPDLH